MTTITEDYVSFETAKLLKDKGFGIKEETRGYYPIKGDATGRLMFGAEYHHNTSQVQIAAPTLQTAMKWLREVHNIMVSPYALSLGYYFEIFDLTNRDITGCKPLYKVGIPYKVDVLSIYEEACEAAIKYCLENLI